MKVCLFFLFLVFTVVTVTSAPLEEDENRGDRHRKVTCDLLSSFHDSACSTNCLSMGKAGGTCSGGICECRKVNVKDFWDKRFPQSSMDEPWWQWKRR